MDTKGPLTDTKIKIIPSTKLIEYLKKLKEEDFSENISKIVNRKYHKIVASDSKIGVNKEIHSKNFELTKKEQELIDKVKPVLEELSDIALDSNPDESDNPENTTHLMVEDIEWIFDVLNRRRESDKQVPFLYDLLEGAKIILPENEVIKRNPELEARCVKLRAQQEAREYRAMTKSVDNVRMRFPEDSISYQLKHLNRQLIAIGQFLISIFAGFLFGFLGVELMIGNLDFGFRLLLGVMCALVIALAEIYFLAKKLNEEMNIPETSQLGGPPKFTNIPPPQLGKAAKQESQKIHQD